MNIKVVGKPYLYNITEVLLHKSAFRIYHDGALFF